ncbi:Ig-like domain (group 4) [Promicromonospora umidemergens]|uniref:Ig-like domain-containing protein n=1 Tax=Promicromonospora umidemergens TaxID=629679 RepID=A0ABP8XKW1_9MICO|nr:LamG-like jellyroll fold domain-containing protein [Promicromonospora umidemergens]MCP2282163.1 Ig-like domain (group 4) [Promicromonospora umidemergens]
MSTTPSSSSGAPARGPARRRSLRTAVAALATLALAGSTAGAALAAPVTATTGTTARTAEQELPAPHLHYTMDDVAGDVVPDASGNGLDGAISGTTSPVDAEGGGTALDLPGGADGGYVTIPRAALEGATDLTVSARVRWDGAGGAWQRVFDLGTDSTRYLFATPSNGDGRLRTALTTNGGGGEAQVGGYGPLRAEDWVTLTVTLDTAADELTTYLDGVAVGSAPSAVAAGDLLTDAAQSAGYLGKSFYPDPLLDGAIDDFRLYQAALSAEQVAQLVEQRPDMVELTKDTFEVRTTVAAAPDLPEAVRASYTDGYDRAVPVVWDEIDPAQYAQPGELTVSGHAAGTPVTAVITVHRGELRVDLGSATGAFHGGASGTLYGLYGDGLPSDNLIEGMGIRTVSTKAQDGPQHPGADALEVVRPLADATDGDVYIYMTDIHRGFPYEWPGDTPQEKLDTFVDKIATQVDQVLEMPAEYQDNVVFVPFNEPEGNMFGTGQWSYDGTSWLDDPTDYLAAWDRVHAVIKDRMPGARIAGPNTSILYGQVKGYLEHTVEAGTVPDVMTWHELSHPEKIRESVATYRGWEADVFAGTEHEGTELPVNINEYAFNYHTSVPGQMIQWISAIEDSKVDADIAYWNIDGNLSDSAVQSDRGNGQWWLFNAYAQMSGHTVEVTPPFPGENYTLQGVATLDTERAMARTIVGGSDGAAPVELVNVPEDVFGDDVRVTVREIPWTGQLGDSAQPRHLAETTMPVTDGKVVVEFDGESLPLLRESSAYEIVVTPAGVGEATSTAPTTWEGSYEAEDATHTGSGYSLNGPEGSPADVGKFYTSGGYDVSGLRTGSDLVLDFEVTVPQDGTYDLSVFANSQNTFEAVAEQGPTNVFVRVDDDAEQELHLPLGYKWVVWDHADTTVDLTAGTHTISLAARSLDGSGATQGDAIVDRITLALPGPDAETSVYEAEHATLDGGRALYEAPDGVDPAEVSGAGGVELAEGETATFWLYGATDGEATLSVDTLGGASGASGTLAVNGRDVLDLAPSRAARTHEVAAHLSGGVNKVVVTGGADGVVVDRLTTSPGSGALAAAEYQAEDAELAGSAAVSGFSLAEGGKAVTDVGGEPGNGNTLTFRVDTDRTGPHAVVLRYSNPEQSPASHYNPDPIARRADISVNGGESAPVLFPHSFHENSFWEKTVVLDLEKGENTITLSSQEAPNFDGSTFASDVWPDFPLRSRWAPVVDRITVSPLAAAQRAEAVKTTVEGVCRGPRAFLVVSTKNVTGERLDVRVSGELGNRSTEHLAPGRTWRQTFPARSSALAAGSVTVTAAGVTTEHTYPPVDCD